MSSVSVSADDHPDGRDSVIACIIAISRGIGKRRRHLKNLGMRDPTMKYEKDWLALQIELHLALKNSFQISDPDLVNYPDYLEKNFDSLSEKLTPDIISILETIITKMRRLEIYLQGMMDGIKTQQKAHREALGNYCGLISFNRL